MSDERHLRITCAGQTDAIGFGSGESDTFDYEAVQAEVEVQR